MIRKMLKNNKGFTLVEVIVVAVIVAILALVAIQLYQGYTKDARQNTAENLAASAAGYLQAEENKGSTITTGAVTGGGRINVVQCCGNNNTSFFVPNNGGLNITSTNVTATIGNGSNAATSKSYAWKD